jgi:hypothetical protein
MYVSTSIEGTEVTFNHIDEYDDSESENETEETSSSQHPFASIQSGFGKICTRSRGRLYVGTG